MSGLGEYETDFYGWAMEQAALLRTGRLAEADLGHIAEEIESMGKSERRELVNRLTVLLAHLLKWQVQSELRGNSWRLTIIEQRRRLTEHLDDNPSLQPLLSGALAAAYRYALLSAQRDTGLPETSFPGQCPWTFEQATNEHFWPDR
ncbi:MAG TPA: DUF29 domain-containing protein [Acetobacteraceae bacterium]|nr:DUF29 domain-containing protein [Acetobacteraceae bacterium]